MATCSSHVAAAKDGVVVFDSDCVLEIGSIDHGVDGIEYIPHLGLHSDGTYEWDDEGVFNGPSPLDPGTDVEPFVADGEVIE